MHRIAAVVLPLLRLELTRAELGDSTAPLALVVARDESAVKDERSLLGNTKLDEVSPEARKLGVHAGQTIAAARARCATLRVRVVQVSAVRDVLSRIAESLLALGTTTAFDVEEKIVWVNVTGCGHLHRTPEDPSGEPTLGKRIHKHVRAMKHASKVAIADGARVAAAVARHGAREAVIVVPPGGNAAALALLPLHALPLPEDAVHWLTKLGLTTVGELARIPRASLAVRLGPVAPRIMALLAGDDAAPLTPHVPASIPEEVATLEYGIESTEALLFVMKRLCDGLAARIAGRALAISRLGIVFKLDRAMAPEAPSAALDLAFSAPLREADELLRVVRARLDSYKIEAPILAVTLRGTETVPSQTRQADLFVPEARADRVLPRLAAELEAELGPGVVGTLQLENRWSPAHRSVLVPLGATRELSSLRLSVPDSHAGSLVSGAIEPTRWLGTPLPSPPSLPDVRVVGRIEASEWWTAGFHHMTYGTAWIESMPALAWVDLDDAGRVLSIRGWLD